ncbi:MAG: di-heme-cytochrome C peroxidase [Acidobacteriota bacterium]
MRILKYLLLLIVITAGAGYAYLITSPKYHATIPQYQAPGEVVLLPQGWTDSQRLEFHHTSQGTRLVPYEWFKALEQPCISLLECEPFSKPEYLSRFGFIASKADPKWNPDGFPLGFAVQSDFFDPISKKVTPVLGLTCAACHTGELRYDKYSVLIEGAPATIEVTQFQKALGLAMGFTQKFPFRYGRFEKKILGSDASAEKRNDLKQSFDAFMANATTEIDETTNRGIYKNEAGFTRTDALTRIGNQVFAVDMKTFDNLAVSKAPVRFPQIWDASWFDWVQYNSSISDPLVRNIGEALGVRAVAKLYDSDAAQYTNSVNVEGLHKIEAILAGPAPYQGLQSPKWPAVFPALDTAKVARGEALYMQHCSGCHLPPIKDLVTDLASSAPKFWWKNGQGKLFMNMANIPLDQIGTDRHEAEDFKNRKADATNLGLGQITAAEGLRLVTTKIRDNYYAKVGFPIEKQIEWNGFRDPADETVQDPLVYKARPLNGIWAVGPYLHNGSVPNLYVLLSPKSERPVEFWTGSKQFDPVKVGRDTGELADGYLFKTSQDGNANSGHEFNDGPKGNGIIGPKLSEADRWALVEYLKSI